MKGPGSALAVTVAGVVLVAGPLAVQAALDPKAGKWESTAGVSQGRCPTSSQDQRSLGGAPPCSADDRPPERVNLDADGAPAIQEKALGQSLESADQEPGAKHGSGGSRSTVQRGQAAEHRIDPKTIRKLMPSTDFRFGETDARAKMKVADSVTVTVINPAGSRGTMSLNGVDVPRGTSRTVTSGSSRPGGDAGGNRYIEYGSGRTFRDYGAENVDSFYRCPYGRRCR